MYEAQKWSIGLGISLARKRCQWEASASYGSDRAIEQYPTEELALAAVNGLRVSINEICNRQRSRAILCGDLIDHYKQTELCYRSELYSEATKVIYAEFLKTWIRPHWARMNIRDVRTIVVENWLRQLRRKDGSPLANTTKTKIRSLMSVLFNHAIRYEWLEQGKNPITLVRQSTVRQKTPEVLDPKEIQDLLVHLESPYRVWYCSLRRLVCGAANCLL